MHRIVFGGGFGDRNFEKKPPFVDITHILYSGFPFAGENFREFRVSVAIRGSFLRENLFSTNSRKFSAAKENHYTVLYSVDSHARRAML